MSGQFSLTATFFAQMDLTIILFIYFFNLLAGMSASKFNSLYVLQSVWNI